MEQEELKNQEEMENRDGLEGQEDAQQSVSQVAIVEESSEMYEKQEAVKPEATDCVRRHRVYGIARLIFDLLMLAAVITLFVLYGKGRSSHKNEVASNVEQAIPGNGDILYVNIDSINANYEMVKILTDSIDAEKKSKEIVFQNRQKALETKLRNYQNNLQSGQLNAQQAQYAEASLQQESQQLQSDYEQALSSMEARYAAALTQISDSLMAVTKRINTGHNASFILTYGGGSNLIVADPTKDITNEVLNELNKPFKKK